eukprot:jgi/Botrbrau1/7079/Bobra.0165s0101.1
MTPCKKLRHKKPYCLHEHARKEILTRQTRCQGQCSRLQAASRRPTPSVVTSVGR